MKRGSLPLARRNNTASPYYDGRTAASCGGSNTIAYSCTEEWFGILAPSGTLRAIVDRWHRETVRALKDPEVRDRLVADGADPVGSSPEDFAAYLRSETIKWAKVVKDAGIKPE